MRFEGKRARFEGKIANDRRSRYFQSRGVVTSASLRVRCFRIVRFQVKTRIEGLQSVRLLRFVETHLRDQCVANDGG